MPTSKAGLNSQAYAELQEAVASLQAQIDNLGGGVFRVIDFQSGQIAAGASGTLLTKNITDVAGATAIKITYLLGASSVAESDIQLTTSSGFSLTGSLCDTSPNASSTSDEFCIISSGTGTTAFTNVARVLTHVYCDSFDLIKTSGVTSAGVSWAIEYGVVE